MNPRRHFGMLLRAAAVTTILLGGTSALNTALADHMSFKEDVFPVIELRCLECHRPDGPGYETSGLDLRTYESLMKGTKHGPVIIPRRAMESNLLAVIDRRTDPKIWMPHEGKRLSKCERLAIRHWINQGAENN